MTLTRIIFFCSLCILSVFLPPWVIALLTIAYAIRFHAYELLIAAAAFDAFFATYESLPYYTIAAIVIVLAIEWVKPHLLFSKLRI